MVIDPSSSRQGHGCEMALSTLVWLRQWNLIYDHTVMITPRVKTGRRGIRQN